jgi:hypothetical protein
VSEDVRNKPQQHRNTLAEGTREAGAQHAQQQSFRTVALLRPTAAPEWALSRTITVRKHPRLVVEITAGPGGMTAEWSPDMPRALTPGELHRYRRGRDQLLVEVAERMGGGVMLIEA